MRVGIIGCGQIAARHVQAIHAVEDAEIVGVADVFEDYARAFAHQFRIQHTFDSATKLIEHTKPDVVHVLTPPTTHCGVALECLERSCHVLVEKPLALDVAEAELMIEAARRRGVLLSVDHNCRFQPLVRHAAELLASGVLGDLVTLEVDFGYNLSLSPEVLHAGAENSHWAYKLNGGPLQDLMPHPASLILEHLKDVKDLVILSRNRGILPRPWPDEIRVLLEAEPAHAEIYISCSLRPDAIVFTIRGTEGTVRADLGSMIATVEGRSPFPRAVTRGLAGFSCALQNVKGAAGNIINVATGRFDKTGGIKHVVAGFYDAIRRGIEPPVTMEEGRSVVELIQRIWAAPLRKTPGEHQADALENFTPHMKRRQRPTALVTGASGFIGSHLVQRLLLDSVPVRAFVRPRSYGLGMLKGMNVEIVQGDLSNPQSVQEAVEGIETIFHVGAAMSGNWETHRQSTVVGTANVTEAAIHANVKRLVHFSTLGVYRVIGVSNGAVIEEDWPYEESGEKLGPYARAKVKAEKLLFRAHTKSGLAVCIVRPGMVIGPRGRVFFPHLGYRHQDKVFIVFERGDTTLPLIYIDNLVSAVLRCANSDDAIGKAYNLVDDGSVSVLAYLNRFIEEARRPAKIIKVPYILPYCAAGAYEIAAGLGIVKKGVTSRRQLNWKHNSLLLKISNARAKKDLGWSCEVPMDEALTRTFRWYAETRH